MRSVSGAVALACVAAIVLGGCERAAQNMYDQPRGKPYRGSPLFADGAMSRTPAPGIQAYSRGSQADTTSGRDGTADVDRDAQARQAAAMPGAVTLAMLTHGKELYGVYCLPCHSPVGDGDGRIVERGFPAPPTYHSDRLRNVPDRHIYDVISNGFGVMAPYGNRIRPSDRWAIVAFVRALQLSQHAEVGKLPADVQAEVRAGLAGAMGAGQHAGASGHTAPATAASPEGREVDVSQGKNAAAGDKSAGAHEGTGEQGAAHED